MANASYRTVPMQWSNDGADPEQCARCAKTLNRSTARWVRVVDGGASVLHPGDEAWWDAEFPGQESGDMGCFLVGPDCAKRIGFEFTSEVVADA